MNAARAAGVPSWKLHHTPWGYCFCSPQLPAIKTTLLVSGMGGVEKLLPSAPTPSPQIPSWKLPTPPGDCCFCRPQLPAIKTMLLVSGVGGVEKLRPSAPTPSPQIPSWKLPTPPGDYCFCSSQLPAIKTTQRSGQQYNKSRQFSFTTPSPWRRNH